MATYGIPTQAITGLYPGCLSYMNGTSPNQNVVVHANQNGTPEQVAASLDMSFGMTLWLAFVLHAVGIEIYVCGPNMLYSRIY